jgi:uncharacterized membrane protein
MTTSKKLSSKNSRIPHVSAWVIGIVSLIGFSDATFLAIKYLQGSVPPCHIGVGCDIVTRSSYAAIGPIPVALLGSLYYLLMGILAVAYLDTKKEALLQYAGRLSVVGVLASAYFVFLQIFVLKAICIYCMASATTSTVLFIVGMWYLVVRKKREDSVQAQDLLHRELD